MTYRRLLSPQSLPLYHPSVHQLMPRLRPKPKTITGHIDGRKYSSLWFAVKAVHSSKLLANNSSQLNHNYLSFNGFMDNKAEDGLKNLSLNHMDSSDDNCDQQMATNERNVSKDCGVKVVEVNDKMALVLVANEDLEYELGCGCVRFTLLSHNFDVHMNGFTLTTDKSVEMMAVFGHKVTIKCQNNGRNDQTINDLMTKVETLGAKDSEAVMSQLKDNLCVILVEKLCLPSLLYLETVDNFKPLSMKSESTWFDMRSVGTNGFESIKVWDKLFDDLQFGANDVIVVTGGTNVGKSSLIRHLINRYLNKRDTECMYLDCDPGQSEFSTSAQLGLTRIQSPVLCSTAMNVIKHKPLMACSVGATTPSKAANLYISSVYNLVNFYQKDLQSKGPLFVNTMGWTRDLGLALLTDTIKIALPTHVIQMNSTADQSVNIGFDLTPESVKRFNGYRYSGSDRTRSLKYKLSIIESNNKRSKKSQTTRDLQQLSYMSQMPDIAFKPFFAMTPYKLLWSRVLVHIMSDYHFNGQLSLDVLNCCWIQLCRFDGQRPRYFLNNGLKIVKSIDGNTCLGAAVIRGIDFQKKCFYILSPESREVLDSVNCIVKASGVQIPEKLLLEQLNYSSTSNLPYICTKT